MDADGLGADEGRDVAGNLPPHEEAQVFVERGPFDGILDVALIFQVARLHRRVQRPHGPAFAHDFERDALPNLTL